MNISRPILFSAVQPSGQLTLGNYLGTMIHWKKLQEVYRCIYGIADLHTLTVSKSSCLLQKRKLDTLSFYLASGIDPNKSIIFNQSDVHQHCQLYWILNCYSYFGELKRMTQFKTKSELYPKNINSGLFNYPILMAADILLYQSNQVLIGSDQKQHLELTRNIANRFNGLYGYIFTVPEVYLLQSSCSKIMALSNPSMKMSKTDANINNVIFLLEEPRSIFKKINRCITDTDNKIFYDINKKPGISNLLNIYASLTGKSILELEKILANVSYKDFKYLVASKISKKLNMLQKRFFFYRNRVSYLQEILRSGAIRAQEESQKTINSVYNILGL